MVGLVLVTANATHSTSRLNASEPLQVHKDAEFTAFFQRTSGWVAGDGALSVPLSDGRVLWLFGDSHIDDYDAATATMPCLFQARNAGIIHSKKDLRNPQTLIGKGPVFKSWFKNSTNEDYWFWPVTGFQNGSVVYVYLAAMRKTGTGGQWGFESAGHDFWGKVKFPEMSEISYEPLPPFQGITFGQGFINEGKYTYAFGGKGNGKLGSDLFVARFESRKPEIKWNFWNGKSWGKNVTNAVPIARGASTSIHVCKVRDKFVLLTSAFSIACDQGRDIFISTSASPTGPFSPLKKIFTVDDAFEGHYPFFYFPVAHPEFINERDELLVTYSINGYEPCVSACVKGRAIPDHYRPKAIRVPLAMIK